MLMGWSLERCPNWRTIHNNLQSALCRQCRRCRQSPGSRSVIGKVVNFSVAFKAIDEGDCLTESGMSFQILGARQEKLLCPKLLLQRSTDNKSCLTQRRDRWGWGSSVFLLWTGVLRILKWFCHWSCCWAMAARK